MAKTKAVDIDAVPRVTVFHLARELGCTPDAACALCGDDLQDDWRGAPSVPASVARAIVLHVREDEARRAAEDKERTQRRQLREEFVRDRYRKLLVEHPKFVGGTFHTEQSRGDAFRWPEAALVGAEAEEIKLKCWAQAEKEADKRGL